MRDLLGTPRSGERTPFFFFILHRLGHGLAFLPFQEWYPVFPAWMMNMFKNGVVPNAVQTGAGMDDGWDEKIEEKHARVHTHMHAFLVLSLHTCAVGQVSCSCHEGIGVGADVKRCLTWFPTSGWVALGKQKNAPDNYVSSPRFARVLSCLVLSIPSRRHR